MSLPTDAQVKMMYCIEKNNPDFEMARLRAQGEIFQMKLLASWIPQEHAALKRFFMDPTPENLAEAKKEMELNIEEEP